MVAWSISEHSRLECGKFSVYNCFSSHFPLQKPPGWHHEARMAGCGKLLKKARGERWFEGDCNAKTVCMGTWQFISEVISLAVLWVDSKSYQGKLDEIWLLKNAVGAIFCRQTWLARHLQNTHGLGVGCVACRWSCEFPRHSFRSGIGKLQICKHSSNRMVIVQSVDGLMANFLTERKRKGLTFAVNAKVLI